jgi:hypothetical protein
MSEHDRRLADWLTGAADEPTDLSPEEREAWERAAAEAVAHLAGEVHPPLPDELRSRIVPGVRPASRAWMGWAAAAAIAATWVVSVVVPTDEVATVAAVEAGQAWSWTNADGQVVAGRVVWDASRQTGWMELDGLPVNDPSREQYQLWVFDAGRDERFPVDGGVFDITPGVTRVPIRTALPVSEATLFAVTVERPGGVVVSDRARIVRLAKGG